MEGCNPPRGLTPIKRPQCFIYIVESHDFTCSSSDSDHHFLCIQAFSFMETSNIFLPLTEGQLIRTLGLIIQFEKHKLQHAEEVEAGPVPFLPFSSSSSVLLQLSVEPWKMETSNKEWVDAQEKGGREPDRQLGMWVELALVGHVWTFYSYGHRQPDRQDGWTDVSLPGAQTSQDARIRAASCDCVKVIVEDRVCAAEELKFGCK